MTEETFAIVTLLLMAVAGLGVMAYRRKKYRDVLSGDAGGSISLCAFCGEEFETAAQCSHCNFDETSLRDAGLDGHVDFLKGLRQSQQTLESARRLAGGALGPIEGIINLVGLLRTTNVRAGMGTGSYTRTHERLNEQTNTLMRALRELTDLLDDHPDMRAVKHPEDDQTVEQILSKAFDTSDSPNVGMAGKMAQASVSREISTTIARIKRTREAVVRDAKSAEENQIGTAKDAKENH